MAEKNETTTKRGKQNGYKSTVLHQKRNRKRRDAEARDREYQGLSLKDRLKRVKSRRGENKKEVARLKKLIAESKDK